MAKIVRNPYLEGNVIKAFNEGLTGRQIAARLGISRGHYQNIASVLRKENKMGYRLKPHQIETVAKNRMAAHAAAKAPAPEEPGIEHRLRLRTDFDLVIRVPDDLTHDEVDRIGFWFRAIVR